MSCLYCSATTTNGLALCERCRVKVTVLLEFVPIYFRNLARWRPGRAGSRPVPQSRVPAGVFPAPGDPVSVALDEAGADLSTWARCLVDDRPHLAPMLDRLAAADLTEAETMRWVCLGFTRYLTTVSTLEWAGQFMISVTRHEATLRALTEQVAPGWYAGSCRHCQAPTHVVPGLTWVTCGECGATTYARDHLDTIISEALGWVARPTRIAEAIVALVDTEPSVPRLHDRIRRWNSIGWLDSIRRVDADGDPIGPKFYRFGDVLDLVLGRVHETRGPMRMTPA